MKKIKVLINETHQLLDEQITLLNNRFGDDNWERLDLPSSGMTLKEMQDLVDSLHYYSELVIASPVPAIFKLLSTANMNWSVFHNDMRDKKELPNGKIIMTVAKTGWVIF